MIPLVDLGWQHREIADEIRQGIEEVVQSTAFVLGPAVADFEQRFARFVGVPHCIGVGSGTDALEFALRALDIGDGAEVILPANTFIASALAVVRALKSVGRAAREADESVEQAASATAH